MKRKVDAHMIAVMGLLIALMVVLSQILGFETSYIKITFSFVPQLIMGMLFGPFWTAVGSSLADIAGMVIFPKSAYFFGFTINAFVGGLIYGYFFYRKEVTLKRAATVVLLNTILITLILTPIWLAMMLNIPLAKSSHHVPDTNCVDLHRRACGTIQTADPTVRLTSKKER